MTSMDEHVAALEARIASTRLRRLLLDWDSWRRGREFPSRADVDPAQVKYMLGGIVLLDVSYEPLQFRYRLMGAHLAQRRGSDMTGKLLNENPDPELAAGLIRLNTLVIETRQPQLHAYNIHGKVTGRTYNYDALNMPLSQDGTVINMIFSGSAYPDDEPG
jgi:hypothetical protein